MRKSGAVLIGGLLIVLAAFAGGGVGSRAEAGAQGAANLRTVTGQVVCLVCYARNKANTGADHDSGRLCARACIKWEGSPVGLLSADGRVYQLAGGLVANNNAKVLPHIAHTVVVSGEVYEKDGMTLLRADDMKPAP
jgi:hypothetical protein